jgi:hypothetical protein
VVLGKNWLLPGDLMNTLIRCFAVMLFILPSFAMSEDRLVRDKNFFVGSDNFHYNYSFGEVRIQWPAYGQITVTNTSNEPIFVHELTTDGDYFSAYTFCPYEFFPGDSCFITVKYEAFEYGEYQGQVRLHTSAGTYKINLNGRTRIGETPGQPPEPQGHGTLE